MVRWILRRLLFVMVIGACLDLHAEEAVLQVSSNEPSLKVPDDLEVDLVLQDPLIANPLYMHFDARGRLWLVEYRQYPWPAGLKLLSRDAVWRNRYEPSFAPPPPHLPASPYRGRDRVSIHEDTNGDGTLDRSTVFLDGLNFATAALPGRGGVFVMNPPYLLFYADRNQDDVPDSAVPRVLLSGFGIEDSHSIANSLRWGPDGWIYATQGSTVTGAIVRHGADNQPLPDTTPHHSMGQNVWRYHPEQHRYEVFAEGGGNAFGVEIDQYGRIYSGHNGGNTRGFHYVQGGYYQKTFGKHGNLSNPFAFGYFSAMQHHQVQRFTHTFVIYEADGLPKRFHGNLLGINPVEHYLINSRISGNGSSRKTSDIGTFVQPGIGERADWFTPVDIQIGPDGAIYLADWFSVQSNHYRNHEGETNPDLGRVLRIRPSASEPSKRIDLESLSSIELCQHFLQHPNKWFRQQTVRILGDRKDAKLVDVLLPQLHETTTDDALGLLWASHASGGLNENQLRKLLDHPNEHVRRWTVRLWGDQPTHQKATAMAVAHHSKRERNVEVLCQIICTARRLKPRYAQPIIEAVLRRDELAEDIHLPLSLWWAVENFTDDHDWILSLFRNKEVWEAKWLPGNASIAANLTKKYAIQGDQSSLVACANLMALSPDVQRPSLSQAFAKAMEGQSIPPLPAELENELAQDDPVFASVIAIRRGDLAKIEQAVRRLLDSPPVQPADVRAQLKIIAALGETRSSPTQCVPAFLRVLDAWKSVEIQIATLAALQRFDDESIGKEILSRFDTFPAEVQETAVSTLTSRKSWAFDWLAYLARQSSVSPKLVTQTRAGIGLHHDSELEAKLNQVFPPATQTPDTLAKRAANLLAVVKQGNGQPLNGRSLFHGEANCGKCHQLFNKGGDVGPDLTPYNRTRIRDMIQAILRPNAEIREGYENHIALTDDGQVVSGLLVDANEQIVVLRTSDGHDHPLATDSIEDFSRSPQSLMPSGLLDNLSHDEIRDLFAYLMSTTPPK